MKLLWFYGNFSAKLDQIVNYLWPGMFRKPAVSPPSPLARSRTAKTKYIETYPSHPSHPRTGHTRHRRMFKIFTFARPRVAIKILTNCSPRQSRCGLVIAPCILESFNTMSTTLQNTRHDLFGDWNSPADISHESLIILVFRNENKVFLTFHSLDMRVCNC